MLFNHSSLKTLNQKGFTLLEITVVLSIIGLLSFIMIIGYRGREKRSALLHSAYLVAQGLRQAEEMAISSQKTPDAFPFNGVFPRGGYGVYISEGARFYVLFADCDGNGKYSNWGPYTCAEADSEEGKHCDETIEKIYLKKGVRVKSISPGSLDPGSGDYYLSVTFLPPDPIIKINGANTATIVLCLENDETITRTIIFNKVGLIDVK